jgi:ComF family protein
MPPVCPLCGRSQSVASLCEKCASDPLCIDGIRSVALFEGPLREAIHCFKYDYMRELAEPLAGLLIDFLQKGGIGCDVILPVPLHRRRLRERGYNQAAVLAERLGQEVGIPLECEALYRNRHTASQTGLSSGERTSNVAGAFSCVDARLAGARVLLIDDVCTTGATLEACSIALKASGVSKVWALTVARAI